ncbi:uncharacterized protein LOC106665727 [Cimex lectularius]|uniref:F-box domain-containing protein n=1 Tax=Cimex lectularius TaxID=79782 RepID=A0A8I6TDU7_CIMLE|nr:uncharacterized protein LOC106665727 [Cimex lectularius]
MDLLSLMPPEIAVKIFGFLELRDLLNCQAVSKSWYDLTNNNLVWKTFWDPNLPLKECRPRKDLNWMFTPPCKWKMYYMNHMRIIRNWREDKYKRHEINGRWLETTAYDGQTLVINNFGLEVYKIDKGNLVHMQKLKYKKYDAYMCATNTKYIAVKYRPFVLVYVQINDRYRVSHMLYNQGTEKKLTCIKHMKQMDKMNDRFPIYPYWSNLMCILGDTLFVYMPHIKVFYAWDMKNMRCLMDVEGSISDFLNDKSKVYICSDDLISVYDEMGNLCYEVKPHWPIGKVHINYNMILAVKSTQDHMEVCAWEKGTGKEILVKTISVSDDCILHPRLDILLDVVDAWQLERKEIYALDLKHDVTLWKTLIGEYSLLGDLHSIVAERFLLFCTYSRHVFDIHDTKSGNYLYSLYGIDDDDVYASYDILIYANHKNVKLIVHIYS